MILEVFCLRHTISIDTYITSFKVQWLLYIPPRLTLASVCGRSLAWIAGSNSAEGHVCLSLVSVVCCQVEVSAKGRSLVQRSRTECGVSN
jgi:hypothetical protein